ncbi:MAG TPA: potassium transporter [Phycisphaerales bacterium]|nr:potassium transporter [Phycisphaerales bacterium]
MNYRFVSKHLGLLTGVLGASVLLISAMDWYFWSDNTPLEVAGTKALLVTGLLGWLFAVVLLAMGRGAEAYLGRREAMLLVALSWIFGAALSGLPYFLWAFQVMPVGHPFRDFTACYFEAMSGLTTTGATVLSDIHILPTRLLLWRATTHWLGGLGIVVLFVAVLPTLGVGGKKLFNVEAPGPSQPGVKPRIRETARLLWFIYVGMTIVQTVALMCTGMNLFDAICHTFATLATGGFSTKNASAGAYTPAAQIVMIVFMILAGVNFGLYYHILQRQFKRFWRDPEFQLYLGIITVASVIVISSLLGDNLVLTDGTVIEGTVANSTLHGVFQVVSIQTTTGYGTVDSNQWNFVPKMTLLILMFIGGCAGSTGGGIKVVRILVGFKIIVAEIERVFRPNVVRSIKVGNSVIDPNMRQAVLVYILGIVAIFVLGAIAIVLIEQNYGDGIDIVTAVTASAATLHNVGPGFARVGAIENYGWFSSPSLAVMSLLMALGRLEVYALLVLFVPTFWRKP